MKTCKKILASLLLIAMTLTLLVACKDQPDDVPALPEEGTPEIDISEYVIVRSEDASLDLKEYFLLFKNELFRLTGASLTVKTDYDGAGEGKREILLGETNRAESKSAMSALEKAPENAFTVRSTSDKIVVAAKNDQGLIRAMKFFLMTYAKPAKTDNCVAMAENTVHNGTVNLDSIIFDNFAEFSVETTSTIAISGKDFDGLCAYETLIELEHNGDKNGTLFASFATYDEAGYRIYKSTNGGKSWDYISTAEDKYNTDMTDINNPTRHLVNNYCLQPCLYELPKDMGDFKEGTLFLGACSKGTGYYNGFVTQTSSMTLYYSTDLGESWTAYCNVDLAGNADDTNGLWEPYFVFEEETGRVYCFYSDESDEANDKHGPKAQKLVYKYSTDMKTWIGADGGTRVTDEPIIVANCTEYNARPGMISIAKMGNGEYFMVYEICGIGGGCPIYYRKTTNLADWPDKDKLGTEIKDQNGKTLGSAPWCAWTPEGGECGTLFVIGEHRTLFLSFDYGETFISITNPMYHGKNGVEKESYSPYLGFGSDKTLLYYVDNPVSAKYDYQTICFQAIKIW
ncbi:MAG: exo-alpha-sialidase [Ruminococcaceae bacterium]|nr:exo-alpha-sialidase [Oscillospiraceae bacterium]